MQRTSICFTLLALIGLGSALSVAVARPQELTTSRDRNVQSNDPLIATPSPGMLARQPLAKREQVLRPPRTEGRLVVKFGDAVRMRPDGQGGVVAHSAFDISAIRELAEHQRITFRSATGASFESIDQLMETAMIRSGRMQPDLNGLMYVEGAEFALHAAAAQLHDSNLVEFVHWDEVKVGYGANDDGFSGGDPTGACCYDDNGLARCAVTTEATCLDSLNGTYFGDGTACPADDLCEACCVNQNCNLVRETADCAIGTPTDRGQTCGANTCLTGTCCDFPVVGCNDDVVAWDCLDGGGDFAPGLTCADDDPCAAGATGACCVPPFLPDTCGVMTQADCYLLGGYYWGDDTTCTYVEQDGDILLTCDYLDFENGHPGAGDCFDLNGLPHANCTINPAPLWPPDSPWPAFGVGDNGACGDLICDDFDPWCCEVQWDTWCARAAHQFCVGLGAQNTCYVGFKGSCYDENHGDGGCNDMTCCSAVTFIDPSCASQWHADCVQLARAICGAGNGGCNDSTPNLRQAQLYKDASGFASPAEIPATLTGVIPTYDPPDDFPDQGSLIVPGFNGAGWDFESGGEAFTDLNDNGWWDVGEPFIDADGDGFWDRPGGLYGFSETLFHEYGINNYAEFLGPGERSANMVRGEGTRIAVIDRAMFESHEDLNVTVEEGQTMIYLDEVTAPHHGTAVVGIINAQRRRQNGIAGMEGIAPYSDLLFFPMTSVEDGARELQAWAGMLQSLSPGDIICVPYGPTVDANAWEVPATRVLLNAAVSLGFIPVVAAGNSGTAVTSDSPLNGPIMVGASTPGSPYYRMVWGDGGSNWSPGVGGVDIRGWGANVATTGFGGLFAPDCGDGTGPDPDRMYTHSFGGTSAAAAQIAGICASLQGIAKQIYGLPIIVNQMKYALGVPAAVPDPPSRLFGAGEGQWLDAFEEEGRWIGRTLDLVGSLDSATSNLLNLEESAFDGAPGLSNIWVMRGDKLIGSRFSLKADEGNYLVTRSEFTERGHEPGSGAQQDPDFPLPDDIAHVVEDLFYLADGQTVDLLLHFEVEATRAEQVTLNLVLLPTQAGETLFHWLEFYDWSSDQWVFQRVGVFPLHIGTQFVPWGPDYRWTIEGFPGVGTQYLRNDGTFLARMAVVGFGGGFGGNQQGDQLNQFDHRVDHVELLLDGGLPGFGQLGNSGGLQPPIPGP